MFQPLRQRIDAPSVGIMHTERKEPVGQTEHDALAVRPEERPVLRIPDSAERPVEDVAITHRIKEIIG